MTRLAQLQLDAVITAARVGITADTHDRNVLIGELRYLGEAIEFEKQVSDCLCGGATVLVLPVSVVERGAAA